jgi:hypothetical protein
MDFEKKYWSNGEFHKENGEKYFGYVGIYDENAYIFDSEELLVKNNTFNSAINLSKKFFDRPLSLKLELPYKKEDIIFAANDFLYAGTVKTIMERLQENNLYLYKNAIIPNSILPVNESISLFATEDIDEYFFYYIDAKTGEERVSPSNANLKYNDTTKVAEIYSSSSGELLGECKYVINESYLGSSNDRIKYPITNTLESAETVYNKFYKIKNKEFSHIPKLKITNKINSGKLKRYSFKDKGLTTKTQIDPYFYPQRQYKEYQSAKSLVGTWDEVLSANTQYFENIDNRDENVEKWDDFDIGADNIKNVYNIVNDVVIDKDDEDINAIKEDLEDFQAYGDQHIFFKTSKYYDNLSGSYSIDKFDPNISDKKRTIFIEQPDILAIWEDLLKVYPENDIKGATENFNLCVERVGCLIKADDKLPTLSINGQKASDVTYVKINDDFYHVNYHFQVPVKLTDDKWSFTYNFDKEFITLFENGQLKYTLKLTYGTKVPGDIGGVDLRNFKRVPFIEKHRNFTWMWYKGAEETEENLVIESLPTLTYKYLTQSPEWINAEGAHLKYESTTNSNKLIAFTPSEDMTAEDCYIFMTNNILSYRSFPSINRETAYNYIDIQGDKTNSVESVNDIYFIENKYYVSKTYNAETFIFVTKDGKDVIETGYKTADEAFRELNSGGLNNKQNFDFIPHFETLTKSVSETIPGYDFTELSNAAMYIIKRSEDNKYVEALLFLMFKTKVLITKLKHYINEEDNFKEDFYIDLSQNDNENYLEINCIDPTNNNSLLFKSLTDIKLHKNMLYIADGELNMVARYDIEYLISPEEDKGFNINSIKLLDVLQGDGDIQDKIYFNNPFALAASDDMVYIVDRGNKCVKAYTSSLNYVKILKNGYYATHDIQSIAVNPYPLTLENGTKVNKDSLWVFSVDGNNVFLSIIDDSGVVSYGQIKDIHLLKDKYSWTEEIKNVEFSQCNSNHYYLATTKRVYKIQTSKPYTAIGTLNYFKQRSLVSSTVWGRMNYRWTKLPKVYNTFNTETTDDNEITWSYRPPMSSAEILDNRCFTLCGLDGIDNQFNGDLIFHMGTFYDNNKIVQYIKKNNSKFNGNMTFNDIQVADLIPMIKSFNMLTYIEPDSYISSLNNNFINIYDTKLDEIIFEDYINALTFNKMIYAVVHNLLVIKSQLMGHFKAATNIDGLIVYDNMVLDDYFNKLKIDNDSNYFVHDNEVISIVVNRVFENIHNIQQRILDKMQTTFMSTQSFVNNTSRII